MSLQYSGGSLINRLFTPVTRADWVNNVTQALSDAGWTTISGTPGSGSDVKLESAANNLGAKIRFRFLDPGSGNCAQTTMKNVPETITSQIIYSLPAAGVFRVVANKFQFFVFVTGGGTSNTQAPRGVVMGGTLYGYSMGAGDNVTLGWMQGIGNNDTDSSGNPTFRYRLAHSQINSPRFSGLNGGTLIETTSNTGSFSASASIACWCGGYATGGSPGDESFRWEDGTLPVYEAFMSWGTGSGLNTSVESKLKGQLYDAAVLNGFWGSEATISLDGHTWLVITDGPPASSGYPGVLIVAVT